MTPRRGEALLALYRNHPATAPGDRYNWKAHAEARRLGDMLLGWAATQSDESLLHCRNLGPVALRWIRNHAGDPPSPFADLEAENERLRAAAQAVIAAWDQPDAWDLTGVVAGPMEDLRAILATPEGTKSL